MVCNFGCEITYSSKMGVIYDWSCIAWTWAYCHCAYFFLSSCQSRLIEIMIYDCQGPLSCISLAGSSFVICMSLAFCQKQIWQMQVGELHILWCNLHGRNNELLEIIENRFSYTIYREFHICELSANCVGGMECSIFYFLG